MGNDFLLFLLFLKTGSHLAQAGLEFATELTMTLYSWPGLSVQGPLGSVPSTRKERKRKKKSKAENESWCRHAHLIPVVRGRSSGSLGVPGQPGQQRELQARLSQKKEREKKSKGENDKKRQEEPEEYSKLSSRLHVDTHKHRHKINNYNSSCLVYICPG